MKRSNLLTLALTSLLFAAIGCGTDRSPVAYSDPAETAPPSGRHFIAFSSAAAEHAGKLAAIPEEGKSISDWFSFAGGIFGISEHNGPGYSDDLQVTFAVPVGAIGGNFPFDPTSTDNAAVDSVYITMTVYGNTLSTLIVEFEPDGFEFNFPALLAMQLGWDLVDMDLDDLVVWHIHGDGKAEPAEIEIITTDYNATILVDVPGFSRYSGGGGTVFGLLDMVKAPGFIEASPHAGEHPMKEYLDSSQPHRALLIGVALPGIAPEEARVSLDELAALAATAGVTDAGRILQSRPKVDAAFYIGKGKVAQIKSDAEAAEADLLIFDNELSPAQMRNLEDELQLQILDRSLLILEIFARHARTRTAQIQVERAWLNYLLPRLSGRWTHLSRQRGGGNATRGPGETQLALDRRKIGQRQGALSGQLQRIRRQAATGRKQRQGEYKVALVGYTNAGKSSLMRALSSEDVLVQDQLFATLDSTTRKVDLRGGKILLTDTVGFINRLPHHLFESFRTTLEEAIDADLLLHVVDRSHPRYRQQIETVNEVLAELNIGDKTLLTVFNKMDRVDRTAQQQGLDEELQAPHSLAVSAHSGEGLEDLQDRIHALRTGGAVVLHLDIPQHEGHLLSQLHHRAEILAVEYDGDQAHMQVRLDRDWAASQQIKRYVADCA